MSAPYSDWTTDELRSEIVALVDSIERLEGERDQLREVVKSVLDGLTGPESEDAVAALKSEHVDALESVVRSTGENT